MDAARKVPTNYLLLGAFTVAEAYIVSFIASMYEPQLVLIAAFMTAVMVICVAQYAKYTKNDFTIFAPCILLACIGLFCLFIIAVISGL